MAKLRRYLVLALLLGAPAAASAQPFDVFADGWTAEIYIYRIGLDWPTALALRPDGDLYVAEIDTYDQPLGRIRLIRDSDGDGLGDTESLYASGFTEPTGLALLPNGDLYVSSAGRITRVRDTDGDEIADDYLDILTGLPGMVPNFNGDHRNHGIVYGPDGFLYTAIGWPNAGPVVDPRQGSVRRISLDGAIDETYAIGIRNAFGLVFNDAGDLFANDQDGNVADELNHIRQGEDYGWPMYEGTPPPNTGTIGPIGLPGVPPLGMAFGFDGNLYLASHEGAVFEIRLTPSGNSYAATIEQIEFGSKPIALAFDAVNQRMFLAIFGVGAAIVVFEPEPGECSANGDCDDSDPCTDDTCVSHECIHTPNSEPCEDGFACTVGDVCSGGVCLAGAPDDGSCDDGNPCTDDSCSPLVGCAVGFNNELCDDGAACTASETDSAILIGCMLADDGAPPVAPGCEASDINGSGRVNVSDFGLYVTMLEAGALGGDVCREGLCGAADSCGVGFLCNPAADACEVDLMVTEQGSQPGLAHPLLESADCAGCHGDYDAQAHLEPFDSWAGSMMAQASRDPIFWAALDVANHDSPGIGDWCLRCHTPAAWLAGRSEPPAGLVDGCALVGNIDEPGGDFDGVSCHLCHRMMINPAPPPGEQSFYLENGQYWLDDGDCGGAGEPCRRGPYDYSGGESLPPHAWAQSDYVTGSDHCGTCHNVTNPLKNLISNGVDTGIPFPIERTHREWAQSAYAAGGGTASSCQGCHMPQAAGGPIHACNEEMNDRSGALAIHQFAGGNAWIPEVLSGEYPALGLTASFNETRDAALEMLQSASASVELITPLEPSPGASLDVDVRVTNLTGHKLPTGYPEGRRMWIHMEARNAADQIFWESGSYDPTTGILTEDAQLKTYQVVQGIYDLHGTGECDSVGAASEKLFHFVRNDCVVLDNRIPPLGFTGGSDPETQPVAYSYPETSAGSGVLVNFDETRYSIPIPADALLPVSVSARLRYQTASKDYVEFLRDQADDHAFADDCIPRAAGPAGGSRGEILFGLWEQYGRSAPVDMGSATSLPLGDADDDDDGVSNQIELSGPNAGDGNDDGMADFLQASVASLPDGSTAQYVTLELSGGCSTLQDVATWDEASMAAEDASFDYPLGLVAFRAPCAAATLKLWFHGTSTIPGPHRKYGPITPGDAGTTRWYTLPGSLFGTDTIAGADVATVEFALTDGGLGDDTGPDGQIVGVGGPAVFVMSLPGLSGAGLVLLATLLAAVSLRRLRAREP